MGELITSAMTPRGACALLVLLAGIASTTSEVQRDVQTLDAEALVQVGAGAGGIDIDVNDDGTKDEGHVKKGYDQIPGFVFRHMGQEIITTTKQKCEETCDDNEGCRSYSYNAEKKICVWSIEAIQYRIGWEFFCKVKVINAFGKRVHQGKWRSFPDIMYQEPGYKKYNSVSTQHCQNHCSKDAKCQAFSYDLKRQRCYLTDAGIHYDPSYMYYERLGMPAKKNAMDEADKQEQIQADERSAKTAKRARLVASMNKMEEENNRAMTEMKAKSNAREARSKTEEKAMAERRLQREKSLEKRDKRLAKMKSVYNEGYFKAKGVAAEKKSKEKDIKALKKKEVDEKDKRKKAMELHSKRKVLEKRKRKSDRAAAKSRLLKAKEVATKVKNEEVELEIQKEDKVLDTAKQLALAKEGRTTDEKMKEKDAKTDKQTQEVRKAKEFQQKTDVKNIQIQANKAQLKYLLKMSERKDYSENKVNVTEADFP